MSDHVLSRAIIERAVEGSHRSPERVIMCLDRSARGLDVAEGLKLVVDGALVILSGKDIPPIAGIDTGVSVFPANVYGLIEEVIMKRGRGASLADLINRLGALGLAEFVDVTGLPWVDVDTPGDLAKAYKLYWRILASNLVKDGDGPVSVYLNRRLSTRISLWLYRKRVYVNPNIVTLIVAALGILGSALVFHGEILVGVDGEIARLFKASSKLGALLDTVFNRLVDISFIFAGIYHLAARVGASVSPLTVFLTILRYF